VGISTAVVFGAQNIGFAIPINHAKRDLLELRKFGHVCQPFLGIRYIIIDEMIQKQNKLPTDHGALVVRETLGEHAVVPGSSAEKAGVKEFDIITQCDKEKVTVDNTIQDIISKRKVGDTLTCTLLRNGKESEVKVKLEEKK
jgi:serine protease Do